MGNAVVYESPPPTYPSLLKRLSCHPGQQDVDTQFSSALFAWCFRPMLSDPLFVESAPVDIGDLSSFNSKCSYVVFHIYNTDKSQVTSSGPDRGRPLDVTVTSLLASARETLSPRGLGLAEAGESTNYSCTKHASDVMFDAYLWCGKQAEKVTSAVALAALHDIAIRMKAKESDGLSLMSFVLAERAVPIGDVILDDLLDPSSRHTDSIRLAQNHLFSRVVAISRKANALHEVLPSEAVRALRRENTLSRLEALMEEPKNGKRRESAPNIGAYEKQQAKERAKKEKKRRHSKPELSSSDSKSKSAKRRKKPRDEGETAFTSADQKRNKDSSIKVSEPPKAPKKGLTLALGGLEKGSTSSESDNKSRKVPPMRSISMPLPKKGMKPMLQLGAVDRVRNETQESKEAKFARFDKLCSKITDRIFLSSVTIAKDKDALDENGITHVLNCAGVICPEYFPQSYGYKTLQLMDGGEDIRSIFYDILDWFNEVFAQPNTKVLVHCHQGVSRSSSMVILYLMWRDGMDYNAAYDFVREYRGVCKPNTSFMCQLLAWYNERHAPFRPRLYRVAPLNERTPKYFTMRLATGDKEPPEHKHLDPRFCFVLRGEEKMYIWRGAESNDEHLDFARVCVERLKKYENAATELCEMMQGEEEESFWAILGGAGEVAPLPKNDAEFATMQLPAGPYLFRYPSFERISDFNKKSLRSGMAYILQDDMRLFAWIGKRFSLEPQHQREEVDVAEILGGLFFSSVTERVPPRETPVPKVLQGKESPSFWEAFVGRDL